MIKLLNEIMNLTENYTLVGKTKDGFDVVVYTDETNLIPHFHVGNISIKISDDDYYSHGKNFLVLSKRERDNLIKFLNKPYKGNFDYKGSNWDFIVSIWNSGTSICKVPNDVEMPLYEFLRKYEEVFIDTTHTISGKVEFGHLSYCRCPITDMKKDPSISIWENDPDYIPHFHIMFGKKDVCILLEKAEYAPCTEENQKLTKQQKDWLLKNICKKSDWAIYNGTNWELCVDIWNMNNRESEMLDTLQMPDYTNLGIE